MAPADAKLQCEICSRGGVTAGQTAPEALSFCQFDQSIHPRHVFFRPCLVSAARSACRMQGEGRDFPIHPPNTSQLARRQRGESGK
jgi:hypothetical protein